MNRGAGGQAVSVRFFLPSTALAPYISTYYYLDIALAPGQLIEDWLHPEWANLRLSSAESLQAAIGPGTLDDVPRLIATGPTSLAARFVTGPARIWGMGVLPAGWARFLDAPAERYCDRSCDAASDPAFAAFAPLLDTVFAEVPDPVAEAARIDAHLLALLETRPPSEEETRIRAAHAALLDDAIGSVGELAERLGISPRSLERLSRRAFGFAPKLLLRRQRFLRSLARFMLDPSLKWISTLDTHYVDQAHFVRDFKRFMGMSPSAYAALDHPVLSAAAQARAMAAGAPVQALHRP